MQAKHKVQAEMIPPDAWLIETDDDELIEFGRPVLDLLNEAEDRQYDTILGEFVDRIAPDCRLPPARPDLSLWEQFPCQSSVTKRLLRGTITKYPVHKGT